MIKTFIRSPKHMFKYYHEHTMEIAASLPVLWKFFMALDNWSKWLEEFESFSCETELKSGSIIKGKVKNRSVFVLLIMNNVNSQSSCDMTVKIPFFKQNSFVVFNELTPKKTSITFRTEVISFFVPFMRSYFLRKIEKQSAKLSVLLSASAKNY